MIASTHYTTSVELLQEAMNQIPNFEHRIDLNQPTGNFFYNKWTILPEFKNTVWEQVLQSLPVDIGQARLMKLDPAKAYYCHSDMDDRYHLNLSGNKSYLVDLDNDKMYPTVLDGKWYSMDTSLKHSAVNFGGTVRVQLVIRQLLTQGKLSKPVRVEIGLEKQLHNFRYIFDDVYSPWLNKKNKQGLIDDFKIISEDRVSFLTDETQVAELEEMRPFGFEIKL
jgi:hypothetical protein